jgi:S1-C subfamily serine protease
MEHRHHRNLLYAAVFILLVLQVASFVNMSSQVSKIQGAMKSLDSNLTEYIDYNVDLQSAQTAQLAQSLLSQQALQNDISNQLQTLKAEQKDFSAIIEQSLRGVVSIGTDKSAGTGFLIEDNGYIVTNYHVIEGAQRIQVLTYDRDVMDAELMGYDINRDVALLKISGNYNSLDLANSDNLQVGNKVIAIGNPLGLSFTVTEGIVSATNRVGPNGYAEYIQTDVSLNPGNSGGPLIDTKGKVVGVNNFKVGGAENIGFALESNALKDVVNQIANTTLIN